MRVGRLVGLALVLAAAVVLLPAGGRAQTRGGALVVGFQRDVLNIDPHMWTANATRKVMVNVYEGLTGRDAKLNVTPQLAESWTISPDGKRYTFKLRKGVKFHNGREMVGEDVKYSYERILNPKTGSQVRPDFEVIDQIGVPDKATVVIVLKRPYARFLGMLDGDWAAIVPREEVEKYGDLNAHPVGTGPFRFASRAANQHVTLERNPDYYEPGKPYLDKVVFKIIPDEFALMADLKAGSTDLVFTAPTQMLDELKKTPGVSYLEAPSSIVTFMYLNTQREPFSKLAARQALAAAIDKATIVRAAYQAIGQPVASLVPSTSPVKVTVADAPHGLDRARALLREAGYPNGYTFTLNVLGSAATSKAIAETMQAQLKQAGITMNIVYTEPGIYEEQVVRKHDFQAATDGTSEHPDPDVKLYIRLHSKGGTNLAGYANPQVDALLDQGRQQMDPAQRAATYSKALAQIVTDVPVVAFAELKFYVFVRDRVQGFEIDPLTMFFFKNTRVR
ncbi:MAG TPA: ABC transporter substrate-binding protein [Methylomirabilota bacterium]|nr:ABC transporter substrate-binding protein [Methylomirabilota bacterium]